MRSSNPSLKEYWKEYQQLEQIAALPSSWKSRWQTWGAQVLDWLTGDRSTIEIRRTLIDGQVLYSAHDRETNRQLDQASETELRQWLEQRYSS